MSFANRIRLPIYLSKAQFPAEANRFRLSDGTSKTLSVVIRKTYEVITDSMGELMHQRLQIALNHDNVTIEGDRYVGGVTVDGEYEIAWQDWLDWPLAPATVKIQVTPFDATNSNCQTCDTATELELVDDDIGEIAEGDSATMNVFANDSICCFPITAEITSFNTTYLDSATIDETTGDITLTAKNPAPSVGSIVLATYRVTCPDGTYDEADVYGSIAGTEPACEQPADFAEVTFSDPPAPYDVTLSWATPASPPACGYEWKLYRVDQPGLPVATGTTAINSVTVTAALSDTQYDFLVRSNCCDGEFSEYNHVVFTTPTESAENCARFQVLINDDTLSTDNNYFYDYMNCDGIIIETSGENLSTHEHCMLTDETGIAPNYFFVHGVDGPFFQVTYIEPC